MRGYKTIVLPLISLLIVGCSSQPEIALEKNKELVRQFFQEIDESGGSLNFIDKWMTTDFKSHFNSPDAMDLEGYRQFMSGALNGFPEMRHEIHYMVAEGNLVATGITLHMVHTGEFAGIAPTGRTVSVEEIVVIRLSDGKIAEEWGVFDLAALEQQLEAPTSAE